MSSINQYKQLKIRLQVLTVSHCPMHPKDKRENDDSGIVVHVLYSTIGLVPLVSLSFGHFCYYWHPSGSLMSCYGNKTISYGQGFGSALI
jgi:hypothetical protein